MRAKSKKSRYTPEQLDFIREGYMRMNARDLTCAFNAKFKTDKSEIAIKSVLSNHGIKCGRKHSDRFQKRLRIFTEDQLEFLREYYKVMCLRDLHAALNSRYRTTFTEDQIRTAVRNRKIASGRTGCFQKGSRPWNAGTKGRGLTGRNKTSFKKGNAPPNRKPIGSERIDGDGYVWIKVEERDPYTGFPTRYKLKHAHVWEQKNGPIPPGKIVFFADNDKTNCDPENLILISRPELLILNQLNYRETPAELKPTVLTLARLKAKAFSMEKNHV